MRSAAAAVLLAVSATLWLAAAPLTRVNACGGVGHGTEPQPLHHNPQLQPQPFADAPFAAADNAAPLPQAVATPPTAAATSSVVPQRLQPVQPLQSTPAAADAAKPGAALPQQAPAGALEADAEHQRLFSSWMQTHEKAYKPEHYHTRFNIWRENLKKVKAHNADAANTHSLGMTRFADQTESEFVETHACFLANAASPEAPQSEFMAQAKAAPASVDWRNKSAVTPVRDQGNCGSCYTFSSAGAIEGAMALAGANMLPLSVQQILDCSSRYGNAGCNGGLMSSSFSFVKKNRGLCADADYSYKGKVGRCAMSCSVAGGTALAGYTNVPKNQENSGLLNAVAQQPVAVAVAAGNSAWQLYRSGVMNAPRCGQNLDHAVLAVGYGTTDAGVDYWIIKNSWGTSWGEQGYIRLIRGKNMCGVANMGSFPNVELQQPTPQPQSQQPPQK